MIRWRWMVARRLVFYGVLAIVASGCWSDDRRGGVFTEDQLARLREQFAPLVATPACTTDERCLVMRRFGQELFFDPRYSGTGDVACSTCHDPTTWYADGRRENAVSWGAGEWTRRNTISLVNSTLKPAGTFSWTGLSTASDVILSIAWPRAMLTDASTVGQRILADDRCRAAYEGVFGAPATNEQVGKDAVTALELYMTDLVSLDSPFDRFIAGDDGAMGEAAIRGFGIFVGKGMCIECHRGPQFSDGSFRVTGVPQRGAHAPTFDSGREGTGAFLTAPLRNITRTAPYMHDGSLASLEEVVEFYRWGGGVTDFPKDPLMEPLEITDVEAHDLIAFLTALEGTPLPDALTRAPDYVGCSLAPVQPGAVP